MTSLAFIIGMLILGLCIIGAAFVLSGAVTGAAAASKESVPQTLQQPTLSFLTEFDAADYLGVSLSELDYMRGEGMLDETFVAVTSMEQTGEEEYYAMEDGLEVVKVRPIMAPVTRFLFNRQLLDERMLQLIKDGQHVNPTRAKSGSKNKNNKNGENKKNNHKNNENRNSENKNKENKNNGQNNNSNGGQKNSQKSNDNRRPEKSGDDFGKSRKNDDNGKHPEKSSDKPVNRHADDDEIFGKPAKTDHSANSKPGISYEGDGSSDTKVIDIVSSSYFDD